MKPPTYTVSDQYRFMHIFVFFDLPRVTKEEQKAATLFAKKLICGGFTHFQYSIYIRPCGSYQATDKHIDYVARIAPKKGHITILAVTEKQVSLMKNIQRKYKKNKIEKPKYRQLTIFEI